MKKQFEILEFDPATDHVLVKYFTDLEPDGITLNVWLPRVNGQLPDEAHMQDHIMMFFPVDDIENMIHRKKIGNDVIPAHLKGLVKKTVPVAPVEPLVTTAGTGAQPSAKGAKVV